MIISKGWEVQWYHFVPACFSFMKWKYSHTYFMTIYIFIWERRNREGNCWGK